MENDCCLAAELYPILCNPMECSLPGSSIQGISQVSTWSGLPSSYWQGRNRDTDIENRHVDMRGGEEGLDELGDWD